MASPSCNHLDQIADVTPSSTSGCSQCMRDGSSWVHLRVCLTCGEVGCCDSSPNRHASGHARHTGHALASSFEPGEDWVWCYEDEVAFRVRELPVFERDPYPGEQSPR